MESLPIIELIYQLYKKSAILNEKMTKRWKYSLGQSIEQNYMSILEFLICAQYAPKPQRSAYLLKASGLLETVRLKLRLMLELNLANETTIFQIQATISEVGRMLGGWRKASQ